MHGTTLLRSDTDCCLALYQALHVHALMPSEMRMMSIQAQLVQLEVPLGQGVLPAQDLSLQDLPI
jgi:hypothetical protein